MPTKQVSFFHNTVACKLHSIEPWARTYEPTYVRALTPSLRWALLLVATLVEGEAIAHGMPPVRAAEAATRSRR